MSQTLDLRRLRFTPMGDLVRGRITGRLDWRGRLANAALPASARQLIARVVGRTRLWRSEKSAVVDDFVAHFLDGMAQGTSADELAKDFGDERTIAKLIRGAVRRNRPLPWRALPAVNATGAVFVACYLAMLVRFHLARATVTVDYVAMQNAPALAASPNGRAWPLYRQAILDQTMPRELVVDKNGDYLVDAQPGDRRWPERQRWLADHAAAIVLIRAAAAKPVFGFSFGPNGSRVDPELAAAYPREGWLAADESFEPDAVPAIDDHEALVSNRFGQLADALFADALDARVQRDGPRAVADIEAMLGLSRQLQAFETHSRYSANSAYNDALDAIEDILSHEPTMLDEDAIVTLAHRLAGPEVAADVLSTAPERLAFHDLVQRVFTDDGEGDGRLTAEGARILNSRSWHTSDITLWRVWSAPFVSKVTLPPAALVESRSAAVAEFNHYLSETVALLSQPRRDANWTLFPAPMSASGDPRFGRSAIVRLVAHSFESEQENAERRLGRRDGVVTAMALELYRRRHGTYPATLDALVPTLLPRVPVDRITGEPVKYRAIDGAAVIYSVGIDRDDDGGRAAIDDDGTVFRSRAARWEPGRNGPIDADWILFDGRVPPATAP